MQTRRRVRFFLMIGGFVASLAMTGAVPVTAQTAGQPLELPCVTDVTVEMLGQAMPASATGQAMVSARLTIAPNGGFDAHTHPGTLIVRIEAGSLDFTLLDDAEMSVNRAATTGTPAPVDTVTPNEEIAINTGDWFVEEGMVHTAWNHGEEPAVVLLTGLVDPAMPLVICGDDGM